MPFREIVGRFGLWNQATVKSNSLVISMLPFNERATGQLSAYTSSTLSMVSRSRTSAVRWKSCLILLITSTLLSTSISPTVSAWRFSNDT